MSSDKDKPLSVAGMARKENNLDILRLIAAWMILFEHSFALYDGSPDLLISLLGYDSSASLALNIFFAISGYLITASYLSNPSLAVYFAKRFLRIFPALAIVMLITVFVLGPSVTTLPLREYFTTAETYKYLRGVLIFPLEYELPGVFKNVPYAEAVNGSLWSLKIELRCYIAVAILGALCCLRPKIVALIALTSITLYAVLTLNPETFDKRVLGFKYTYLVSNSRWFYAFFAGAALYLFKHRIPYRPACLIAAISLSVAAWYFLPYGQLIHIALLPYIVLYLGLHTPPISYILRRNDLSYGIFIYAFPIQQLYMHYIGTSHGFAPFVITITLAAALCGFLSWRYVERPCLNLKKRIKKKPSLSATSSNGFAHLT